ncbi:MAG: bifunctional 2-polyprenyl-6-hydroxyphenol methylase/3-demethylubiquinol 3-O-methyltransferase UbiG [Burkholderiales bacterium]|nr:bifunctional 2-polyprenyl-6-hydroxyphenol methylase/3-demethylubiquinol 3-O-methyltransferase UbiG [Burkholderiales bacterium]
MDSTEIDKFSKLAHQWWDVNGEFRTLHHINPLRLKFIQSHINLKNKKIIDIGCGGGILAESMAQTGAAVTGLDLSPQLIETAKLHLIESQQLNSQSLNISYECIDIADKANQLAHEFDILTCLEMLEHTTDYEAIISNCNKLLKPGAIAFFSTLNRNLKSYALGVVAAEYIMQLIPRGTHDYKKFIKPSELNTVLTKYQFELFDIKGIHYNPLTQNAKITNNVDINYIVACRKIAV